MIAREEHLPGHWWQIAQLVLGLLRALFRQTVVGLAPGNGDARDEKSRAGMPPGAGVTCVYRLLARERGGKPLSIVCPLKTGAKLLHTNLHLDRILTGCQALGGGVPDTATDIVQLPSEMKTGRTMTHFYFVEIIRCLKTSTTVVGGYPIV